MRRLLPLLFVPALAGCEDLGKLAEDLGEVLDYDGIAQVVPPNGSDRVPLRSPVVIFADDVYGDVRFEAEVEDSAGAVTDISAALRVEERTSGADKDIYVLTTAEGWPASATVTVRARGEIDRQVRFSTVADGGLFDTPPDLGFESADSPDLPVGWRGFGDAAAIAERGSLSPAAGDKQLALSTGDAVTRAAVGDTSSMAVSDPIDQGPGATLAFSYRFQSSEFDDYCGSDFDDTMMVVASGPEGAVARVVDSVNLVCRQDRQVRASFPGLPDDGDDVYKGTPETDEEIDLSSVGSPFSVAFLVTDVGDDILTSVVGVDAIEAR